MPRENAGTWRGDGASNGVNTTKYPPDDQLELELVRYSTNDGNMLFDVDVIRDTIWATERQIADLFQSDSNTVAAHVHSIFEEGELEKSTCSRTSKLRKPRSHQAQVRHNLDVILAVGYRVSSPKATRFRKWATQALRSYVVDGYCVTEDCMRAKVPSNELAQRLKNIRAAETNIYESVRAFFKEGAADYDANAAACTYFDDMVQGKFIFAVTSQTPSELLSSRADHDRPNMGLQTFAGTIPTMDEAKLSQNYLNRDELYQLHILCEQFLLYVRSLAWRGKTMTMRDLLAKMVDLLRVADYPVYQGYKDFYREKALRHAQAEYAMFAMRQKPRGR